jgi:predicted transcriptional regulator
VYSYSKKEPLGQVLSRLMTKRVYRLVCVDSTNRLEGILSLSDILSLFISSDKTMS